jgi:hypothetical protein
MLRIEDCFLVLVLFGLWLVFGKVQHLMLMLEHSEDYMGLFRIRRWVLEEKGVESLNLFFISKLKKSYNISKID